MAVGDKRVDPVTNEPEIELADGSITTDWVSLLGDPNRQMLPLGVGVVVPHFADVVPDDGWLPMSNGTFNDADYPELAAAIAAGNKVGSDLGNGTFRLLDMNGALSDDRGRVLEGLGTRAPGDLQTDATAPNNMHIRTSSAAGGNVFNAQTSMFTNTGTVASQGSVLVSGGDPQSRAPAVSVLWMVRAKPWTHAGDVTINQGGRNIYTNVTDQAVPDTNYNTYAVDLPALEVGDQFTVVMARGVLIYNLIGRFIGFGFEHEFIFDGIVWRVEIVGTQLRIEAFSGGGSQAVKAIFIER